MPYLARKVLRDSSKLEISDADAIALQNSLDLLRSILVLEEVYDLFLSNFYDFELGMYSISLKNVLYGNHSVAHFGEMRSESSRLMLNFLSGARSFLDYTARQLKAIDESIFQDHISGTNRYYDEFQSYRLVEALRNYSQHRGLPLDGISFEGARDEEGADGGLVFGISVTVERRTLISDPKFKKSATVGIREDRIPLNIHLREYSYCLSCLHFLNRGRLASLHSGAKDNINGLIQKWKENHFTSESIIGLHLYLDDQKARDERPVNDVLMQQIDRYYEKNRNALLKPPWKMNF